MRLAQEPRTQRLEACSPSSRTSWLAHSPARHPVVSITGSTHAPQAPVAPMCAPCAPMCTHARLEHRLHPCALHAHPCAPMCVSSTGCTHVRSMRMRPDAAAAARPQRRTDVGIPTLRICKHAPTWAAHCPGHVPSHCAAEDLRRGFQNSALWYHTVVPNLEILVSGMTCRSILFIGTARIKA